MTDTATPEVDTRRFTPNQIAIACAKRLARYADFDENWLAIIVERGIELAEDGAFTITTEGGQTFHLTVTDGAPTREAELQARLDAVERWLRPEVVVGWIQPRGYRERYLAEDIIRGLLAGDPIASDQAEGGPR